MAAMPVGHHLDDELTIVQCGLVVVKACAKAAPRSEQVKVSRVDGQRLRVASNGIHMPPLFDSLLRTRHVPADSLVNLLVMNLALLTIDLGGRQRRGDLGLVVALIRFATWRRRDDT